ncbi:uncharacterized protein LOC124888954 [Capsicum annuum]|uniref:uncharacterized protein LOC124888954 n=1 Tax=Capsicum annuum TaxID=4072 RepID=UPI001FB1963C|nr:uncharacterized protein LOC124888954 [Capsicum annuum]
MRIAHLGKRKFRFVIGTCSKNSNREEIHEQWETCTVSAFLDHEHFWEDLKEIYDKAPTMVDGHIGADSSSHEGTHATLSNPHTFTEEEYTQIITMLSKDTKDIKQDLFNGKVKGIDRQEGGLYVLKGGWIGNTNQSRSNTYKFILEVATSSCSLWHQTLGHPTSQVLKCLDIMKNPSDVNMLNKCTLMFSKDPKLSYLRVFGCLCYVTILPRGDKFTERAKSAVLVGYSESQKGYLLLDITSKKLLVSKDIVFHEDTFAFDSSPSQNTQASLYKEDNTEFLIPTDEEIFHEKTTESVTEEAPIKENRIFDAAVLDAASPSTNHKETCQYKGSLHQPSSSRPTRISKTPV